MALMELHNRKWKRLEALMSEGFPGEKAKQDEAESTLARAQTEPEVEDQGMPLLTVEASDDEDEIITCRSEGGQSSWSATSEHAGARPRATGRAAERTVLVQSRVTYLRERRHGRGPSDG